MRVGYARVSTGEQDLHAQVDALQIDGCQRVYSGKASGRAGVERIGLADALAKLRAGDTFVVWSLDQLGRSLSQLVMMIDQLHGKNVEFRSLKEAIDTASAAGRLQLPVLAALAEFERARIAERTGASIDAARRRGRVGGRPVKLTTTKLEAVKALLENGTPPAVAARAVGVSRATLYRHKAHVAAE